MHAFAMVARIAIAAQSAAPGAQPAAPTARPAASTTQPAPPPATPASRRPLIQIAARAATAPTDSPSAPPPHAQRAPRESLHIEGYPGISNAGVLLGADALLRYRYVEGGLLGQVASEALINSSSSAACGLALGLAGRGRPNGGGLGLGGELLGVIGGRSWWGVGGSGHVLSNQEGVGGSFPFAGVRAGGSFYLHQFSIGLWLGVDDDLGRKHVRYTYNAAGFPGGSNPATTNVEVGAVTVFAALRMGGNIDFM